MRSGAIKQEILRLLSEHPHIFNEEELLSIVTITLDDVIDRNEFSKVLREMHLNGEIVCNGGQRLSVGRKE
jgi:hypothetical protein